MYACRSVFFISLLFCASPAWIQAVYGQELDVRRFCLREGVGRYAHPSECSQFIICTRGLGYRQSCPKGMFFDVNKQLCDVKVTCGRGSRPEADEKRKPGERKDRVSQVDRPYSSNYYAYGQERRGHPVPNRVSRERSRDHSADVLSVPRGRNRPLSREPHQVRSTSSGRVLPSDRRRQHQAPPQNEHNQDRDYTLIHHVHDVPDIDLSRLRLPSGFDFKDIGADVAATDTDNECARDGTFAHPEDCTRYITCTNGISYEKRCAAGTFYDVISRGCGYSKEFCSGQEAIEDYYQAASDRNQVHSGGPRPRHDGKSREQQMSQLRVPGDIRRPMEPYPPADGIPKLRSPYDFTAPSRGEQRSRDEDDRSSRDGTRRSPPDSIGSSSALSPHSSRGEPRQPRLPLGNIHTPRGNIRTSRLDIIPPRTIAPDRLRVLHGHQPRKDSRREMLEAIARMVPEAEAQARTQARRLFRREARFARAIQYDGDRAFSGVAAFLGSTPYIKQLSRPAAVQLRVLHILRDEFDLDKELMQAVLDDLPPFLRLSDAVVEPDMNLPTPRMDVCPYPRNDDTNRCRRQAPYRTIDGSCNNLRRPLWGKSMRPLARFLPPDYADGIEHPRGAGGGRPLPSARRVSVLLNEERDRPSHVHTMMHMTYGQFLAHDLSRTAVTKLSTKESGSSDGEMVDVKCGKTECETVGPQNSACLPIAVSTSDPDFHNKTCLMFVRTQEVPREDCSYGPREQLNQLTPYVDASNVYGSTKAAADKLRELADPARGKMKTTPHPSDEALGPLPPQTENKDCRDLNATVRCFTAGDGRLNEHVGLAATHTVFLRAHNSLETRLHQLNPRWSGERLYQESRKILAAISQHIAYNEYLPIVLGRRGTDQHGLRLLKDGHFNGYDGSVNPDITNSFNTAAFRFGHSQIDTLIRFAHQGYRRVKDVDLSTVLRRPVMMYQTDLPGGGGVDSVLLGHVSQAAQDVDRFFSKQITVHLFSEDPPGKPGLDLPAINTQRGRDHGLPAYNEFRQWCGLSRARTFEDLTDMPPDARRKLSKLYGRVDDVDLYPAGISEIKLPGGLVGPTFACIIARQFRNLRVGDRFWYESGDPTVGFSLDQLREIRKFTLSRLLCDNMDDVRTIQKFVLLQPLSEAFKNLGRRSYREIYSLAGLYRGESNARVPCSEIPSPGLSPWKEL